MGASRFRCGICGTWYPGTQPEAALETHSQSVVELFTPACGQG